MNHDQEESATSHDAVKEQGDEWASSRRSGRRIANRRQNGPSTGNEELRVDTGSKEEKTAEIEHSAHYRRSSGEEGEEQLEAGCGLSSGGSEHSDQLEEPVIPVTVLTSMESDTKPGSRRNSGFVPAEHVAGKDEGDETEDDIALLEYLSGAESDCFELDRASRKGEDGDNPTPVMSLSPRSLDESLGTPGSPEGLISVEEYGRFRQSPIHYMTVTRHMMTHAQEAPRQSSTPVNESPPTSSDADSHGTADSMEATQTATLPRQAPRERPATSESASEWIPCETEDGLTYYYNPRTQESQWTIPASPGFRTHTIEDLFAAVSTEELSETDSRQLSIMLNSGMDLQAVNSDGLTPLHVACKVGNEQAAALLVYYGAKLDARAIRDNATPLIFACRAESEGIVKLLTESDASLSASDSYGNTALHAGVLTGNEGLVMFVLQGCDHTLLSQKNNEGETALHMAAKLGYLAVVRSLLAYGASTKDEDSQGRTPLILSILENHVECVQLLQNVESNASPAKSTPASYYSSVYASDRRHGGGAERDALSVLHSYLVQILPNHSASEAQTVFQLVEEVRGQIGALNASLQASNAREGQYRTQLEEMSSNLATSADELKKEQTLHADTQNQLAVRELELDASRVSHRALSSRCELLESIARNAQEKLGRERLEHTRYEESMQEKLVRSLQENANVIESCRQLQTSFSEQQQQQRRNDHRLLRRDSQGFYEISEDPAQLDSVQESIGESYHLLETEGSTSIVSGGNQSRDRAPSDYQHHGQFDAYRQSFEPYQYQTTAEVMDAPPPLLDDPDEAPTRRGSITPPISPSRVGAVWNRFFENVGHASEMRDSNDQKSYEAPMHAAKQPSPEYPTSSLVFDAVRKNELRKLQEILLRGVSPNQRDVAEKGTPLHLACELGDIESVMLLSEFAADLEARDESRNTPLLAACFQGNFECVKFLLQSAVSLRAVNENGDSALHLAAWDGSLLCVMILLEYGVDPMATNRFGLTALGNMKTRSPMRHKFDDMPEDHPMRRTLVVLEEAEHQRLQQVIEDQSTSTEDANEHHAQPPKQEKSEAPIKRAASWTQWLLGFRGAHPDGAHIEGEQQKSEAGDATTSTTVTEENEAESDDGDEYEESRLTLNETQYEPLTPPPEIEEALRRAKEGQQLGDVYEPPSPAAASAPTFPILKQDLSKYINLSPSLRTPTKPHPPAAPTKLRARYVDTFNTTGSTVAHGVPTPHHQQHNPPDSAEEFSSERLFQPACIRPSPEARQEKRSEMMPASPILRAKSRSMTPDAAVNISSKLRRNSFVSDHEDMVLLREKLTRIAVATDAASSTIEEEEQEQERRRRRSSSSGSASASEHFKVFPLLPPERPSTPPSSPQPRDVLRKQLRLKQQSRGQRTDSRTHEDDGGLEAMMSVDEVEITPMLEDMEVDDSNAVHSPPRPKKRQARLSIPGHLRVLSPFSVLNKYPEGLRKRKSVHVDNAEGGGEDEPRVSLKKTSSQINILAKTSSANGKLSRSSSAGGDLYQAFAARQRERREQDQNMEDAGGCTTQPQSPQNALFGKKRGQLSACS